MWTNSGSWYFWNCRNTRRGPNCTGLPKDTIIGRRAFNPTRPCNGNGRGMRLSNSSSNNNHTSSRRLSPPRVTTTKTSSSRRSSERRNWEPPKSIAVYQPRQSWPDGTLQILWQTPERNVHGMKGIDRFEAHLELTLDDLSTIDIASSVDGSGTPEICSKYSGLSIELHPDETRVHKIGSISCYRVRSQPALQQIDQLDVPPECPQQLSDLLYQLPQKSFFQSWCKPKKATRRIRKPLPLGGEEGNDDELVVEEFIHDDNETSEEDGNAFQEELYRRHHWHPESSKVASYLWVEDLQVDERYRGSGLGFCLLEDACQRVADSNSWMLAHVPETLSGGSSSSRPPQEHPLREYFGLFGFHQMYGENRENTTNSSLEDTDGGATAGSFMARWNASPANPRLEEVLPSVPYTTQQSRDQGFQL
mmetsp:Transcript_8175/g.22676  ORF Transcript_8175/g.22676 Transcript_8175/m.22676 type:complete len:420 (+) Transcript_8175:409-1668(+)